MPTRWFRRVDQWATLRAGSVRALGERREASSLDPSCWPGGSEVHLILDDSDITCTLLRLLREEAKQDAGSLPGDLSEGGSVRQAGESAQPTHVLGEGCWAAWCVVPLREAITFDLGKRRPPVLT